MTISLRTNIQSLTAQKNLGDTTSTLSSTFQKLSSGLRINKASDDAAGLAVAQNIKVDKLVSQQAIRNGNDAISSLNLADAALNEMTNILTRLKELSEQAANGTTTFAQRTVLDDEAYALTKEFNRILESVEYNNQSLFQANGGETTIQLGFGQQASLSFALAEELEQNIFSGTTNLNDVDAHGGSGVVHADLDGDGDLDLITASSTVQNFKVRFNDGNGNFTSGKSDTYSIGTTLPDETLQLADMNNDNNLDVVLFDGAGRVNVFAGNGDGTFNTTPTQTVTAFSSVDDLKVGDFDENGNMDILLRDGATVYFLEGDGAGGISGTTSVGAGAGNQDLEIGDFNADGHLDFMSTSNASNVVNTYLGDGAGNFTAQTAVNADSKGKNGIIGDIDHDGYDDLILIGESDGQAEIHFSNGDGTFTAGGTFDAGGGHTPQLVDLNGDGNLDLIASQGTATSYYTLNDGNGNFEDGVLMDAVITLHSQVTAADFTGDGAIDIVLAGSTNTDLRVSNPDQIITAPRLNLLSQEDAQASMTLVDTISDRVSRESGIVGANLSRLESALANLSAAAENYGAAGNRITDIDTAEQTAQLVKSQVLQDSGSAILAQANQQPSLVLSLLEEADQGAVPL